MKMKTFFATLRVHLAALALTLVIVAAGSTSAQTPRKQGRPVPAADKIPSPVETLGFEPGADRKLADWSQIVGYFKDLAHASRRVSLQEPGLTTEKRPFIYALISSENNIRNLSGIRDAQRKLADPRLIANEQERARLISETPAIVAITCSIHSTEIGASQMSMELAYRLASDNSPATRQILNNVVLLLVPSVNPDGIDIVTNWYRKTLGTKYEGTSPPFLYHHYTGHDDNRDWFMLSQAETRHLAQVLWQEWFPEIVYDVHQQGEYGSRICTPPFFDPANPNIDPLIMREVGWIGSRMALDLTDAGFKGVVTNSTYDTWWHGGLRTAPYYHNEVGILTETASVKIATPIDVKREQLKSPVRGLPNPLVTATNFPVAWEGGTWRLSDIVNMELVTTHTALEEASLHHDELVGSFVKTGEKAIKVSESQAPYAYVVPAAQHDPSAAAQMINILMEQGVEVHQAKAEFQIGGQQYPAGSFVLLMNQPYRADVKCLFEAQQYPDRRIYPGGPAEPPYDVAGWTLPMQMGVGYEQVDSPVDQTTLSSLNKVDQPIDLAEFGSHRGGSDASQAIAISGDSDISFASVNRFLNGAEGGTVLRLRKSVEVNGKDFPRGSFVLRSAQKGGPGFGASGGSYSSASQTAFVATVPLSSTDLSKIEASSDKVTAPRLGVYRSWVPSMDEGWLRWVLEQFEFKYQTIYDADVRKGSLNSRFDVIILPSEGMTQIINGNRQGMYPDEYTGGIGQPGLQNLKDFVSNGGVLICLNESSEFALEHFGLPVKNTIHGLKRNQFYAPGSIFRAKIDTDSDIGQGMPGLADLYFISGISRPPQPEPNKNSSAKPAQTNKPPEAEDGQGLLVNAFGFEITDQTRAKSIARYVDENPLRSGWLLGPEYIQGKSALVEAQSGKGKVILFGFPPEHRGQTWGTFKLLFNSILLGGQAGAN